MELALAAAALVPGLALGSFLGVVATRVPLRRSIVRPGSACDACGAPIKWYDNVPLLSYAALHGRCRDCGARISLASPAIELATALLVAGCLLAFGVTAYAALAAGFCVVLVVLSAIDLQHRIVPNRIVLPAFVAVLAARTALDPSLEWTLSALAASAFLFAAALAYPRGMGMGDVKLALLLGAMLGRSVGVALMLGMIAALVPSAVLVARHGTRARAMAIPLAPFLALGALVALFAGDAILDVYLGLFR